ncbi:UvrD-helicase domain-containing protein [Nocardioides sp. CFH 31398]|uniref:UvrD-helicase domain-containing protein n=1 Tax=Nocardioides sp. CFH 31398 TaxID=2919579 RepID=UPI001F069F9E|nr:UvrD-helicase domain-containing protein [Nocardioides sp. CFH 31398]MCH1865420.1 UvrD-helicase domain-containing protein [Nocardioides sp. CFH 31398]
MSATASTPFDIAGPLPVGTVLLEASAGTGKTWTIGALVTRMVVSGDVRLEDMLVVTFGRAASRELRERVRAQLVEAERVLAGDPSAAELPPSDLLDLLARLDPADRAAGRERVRAALASYDAATIVTTHQFCSLVLDSLGVAGDVEPSARLVEDVDDLVSEVVDDLYLRAFAYADAAPVFDHDTARAIAADAVGDPQARLEPAAADRATPEGRKVAFGEAVRREVARRKRRQQVLSYDDLLSRLADALTDPDGPARARMRRRWSVVLVDEFQDTDPVQWQVLDRAFSGVATMVLIGDPKQAIYAFRGGDVTTYLTAARTAATHHTLGVNRRSDAALLDRLQVLLGGAELGEGIVVGPVEAHHDGSRLLGADGAPLPPFRLRTLRTDDVDRRGRDGLIGVRTSRPRIATDLARDVRRLLTSGATWCGRAVQARDVAVIAYRHADLAAARDALLAEGVPAVIAGGGSVFATPAADEWVVLLEALEQPHRSDRVRAAALTCFVGLTAAELDAGGDDLTDAVADRLRGWTELFRQRGVAAVAEAATAGGLPARVLGVAGGERLLTDVRHVGELLHEVALTERLGLVSLLGWLREQVRLGRERKGSERTRRLDSDAAAVQLVTIHASKGLEYPVVYLPALADRWVPKPDRPLFHDADGVRCRNVGNGGDDWGDHVARWHAEEAGEWLRYLYVAVTRAQSQVVAWWAPSSNAAPSPLHRLLVREPGQAEVLPAPSVPSDDDMAARLAAWEAAGGPRVERADHPEGGAVVATPATPPLALRRFSREVDTTWRRTSYSSLSRLDGLAPGERPTVDATAAAPAPTSEPEVTVRDDEELPAVPTPTGELPPGVEDVASPMAHLPLGATFGSLVHAVLEHADPAAGDWRAELAAHVSEQRDLWAVDVDVDEVTDALVAVCATPLGPAAGGVRLADLPLASRLVEMEFELPLAGGDARGPAGRDVLLGDLAPLLEGHLGDDDPVRPYAAALRGPLGRQSLRGYLTGSVDVVLRVPASGAGSDDGRYLVVDYKTNWLGPVDEPLTAGRYTPAALAGAMTHSDYPLQALLYAVVLHRFLRWRLRDYDPERHLGGVLYLYLRGLAGPDTPVVDGTPCGVFAWRPPAALVTAMSDLLDGADGSPGTGGAP